MFAKPVPGIAPARLPSAGLLDELKASNLLIATTITGDSVCRATNVDYRLDTSAARNFLGQFLTLP